MNSDKATIIITLGDGVEFGLSDSGMFITARALSHLDSDITIDLAPATRKNFRKLIETMSRLEIHMKDE